MPIDYITVGKKIRAIRMREGLSQLQLAEMIEVSPPYISCIENGVKNASIETLVRIANALQVSTDELLDDNLEDELIASFPDLKNIIIQNRKDDMKILIGVLLQILFTGAKRLVPSKIDRVAIDSGRNQWKAYGMAMIYSGKFQSLFVSSPQALRFTMLSVLPPGADRMDDIFCF